MKIQSTNRYRNFNLFYLFYFHFQARNWLIGLGISVLIIYCPNAFFKMKWETAEISRVINKISYTPKDGACASIPTSYWTRTVMDTMVNVDFLCSSLIPFGLMIASNVVIIKKLIKIQEKVLYISV